MQELETYFEDLKQEIQLVREKGYENTDIISKSEYFFSICDTATGLAEAYSQRLASSLNQLERIVLVDIVLLNLFEHCSMLRRTGSSRAKFIWMNPPVCRTRTNAKRF